MNAHPNRVQAPGSSAGPSEGPDRQLAGLKASSNAKSQKARQKVENGIRDLIKTGARISVSSVARASGVSRAFINKHPDLTDRIHALSAQQQGQVEAAHEQSVTGESAVIAGLRRRLHEQKATHAQEAKQLRAQIKELEAQVAALYGRLN